MTNITPIQDQEETHKVSQSAPKRSSSVGAALKRLFSRSPEPAAHERSNSDTSILGAEALQEPAQRVGFTMRGRTPPRFLTVSSPSASTQNPGGYPVPPKTHKHKGEGELLLLAGPPDSSAMASHRGGHLVLGTQEAGGTSGLRRAQSQSLNDVKH